MSKLGKRTAVVVLTVIVVILVLASGLVYLSQPKPEKTTSTTSTTVTTTSLTSNATTTSTSVQSSSLTSNTTTTSTPNLGKTYTIIASSITLTCVITYTITGQSAGARLHVLSDSGSPIVGAQIRGHEIYGYTIVGTRTVACGNCNFTDIVTDSSGLVSLPGLVGSYYLTIAYQGRLYNMSIPMYPVQLTEVTLRIPSGVLSVEVLPYGERPAMNGPSFATTFRGLQLNVTLGSYTVKAGEFQPIRLAFLGSGAWNASYTEVSTIVNNSTGENVWNMTERIPALYSIPYTNLLQEYVTYIGWIPRTDDQNIPITPGEYTMVISANIDGQLLKVQGTVQVTG
jgi:hypothetical protein